MKNLWTGYRDFVQTNIDTSDGSVFGVDYWRNRLFINIILFVVPVGLLAAVPGIWMSIRSGIPGLAAADLATVLICALLALSRNIHIKTRKLLLLVTFYLLSVALLAYLGIKGPVLIYFYAISVFCTLILPIRFAFTTVAINTMLSVGYTLVPQLPGAALKTIETGEWLAVCSNLGFLSLLTVTSVNLLFKGLQRMMDKERTLGKELKDSEELYRELFNKMPLSMFIYDCDTFKFVLVNDELVRCYGYTEAELYDMTIFELLHEKSGEKLKRRLQFLSRVGSRRSGIWQYVTKNGEVRDNEIQSNSINYANRAARMITVIDVTEQNRSEKMLTRQTKLTETIVQNFPKGRVVIIDENYIIQHIGGEEVQKSNTPVDEFINTSYLALFPEEKRNAILQFLEPVFQGLSNTIEIELGSETFLKSAVSVDTPGAQKTIVIASQNITEQRQREKSLTLFETAIINSNDGFAMYSPPRFSGDIPCFSYVNAAFESNTGYASAALLGKFPTVLYTNGNPDTLAEMNLALRQGKEYKTEICGTRKNGEVYWTNIHLLPVRDKKGSFVNYISLHHDITANKRFEAERERLLESLSFSESNLRSLIDNTSDYIWSVDKSLNYIAMNEAFIDLGKKHYLNFELGSPAIGPWVRVMGLGEQDWRSNYEKCLGGVKHASDIQVTMPDDSLYIASVSFNPMYNADGVITGVGCFAKDITQRRQYEKRLKLNNDKLREIAFLTSHSLRAPLSNILALVNLLDLVDFSNLENKELISFIHQSAMQLDIVIREIVGQTDTSVKEEIIAE